MIKESKQRLKVLIIAIIFLSILIGYLCYEYVQIQKGALEKCYTYIKQNCNSIALSCNQGGMDYGIAYTNKNATRTS